MGGRTGYPAPAHGLAPHQRRRRPAVEQLGTLDPHGVALESDRERQRQDLEGVTADGDQPLAGPDLTQATDGQATGSHLDAGDAAVRRTIGAHKAPEVRSEEHTSELQSLAYLVCRLLLEKKKK